MSRRVTVLVVDDEEGMREFVARVLRDEGYHVMTARDGVEALALVEQPGSAVALVITDVFMPHMTGPDMVARLPSELAIPVLFISGTSSARELPGPLLGKPFLAHQLSRLVRLLVRPAMEPALSP